MGIHQKFFGNKAHQLVFNLTHILARRDFGAVSHTENVGINRHNRLSECSIQYHVGSFPADTWQRFQSLSVGRHFAIVFFQQNTASLHDVFGFGFVEAYSFGVFHHAVQPQIQHGLRRIGNGKELGSRFVHADISRLRRQ